MSDQVRMYGTMTEPWRDRGTVAIWNEPNLNSRWSRSAASSGMTSCEASITQPGMPHAFSPWSPYAALPTESLRPHIFWTLSESRSLPYQRRLCDQGHLWGRSCMFFAVQKVATPKMIVRHPAFCVVSFDFTTGGTAPITVTGRVEISKLKYWCSNFNLHTSKLQLN